MRHNTTVWGSPFRVLAVLGILFLCAFVSVHAEGEKKSPKDSEVKKEQSSSENKQNKKSGKESDSGNPGGMDDIDRAWMESIRGEGSPEGRSFSNPGSETAEKGDSSPESSQNESESGNSPTASRMFAQEEGPSFFSLFIRFVLFMGLMAGGFYGLVRFMKKKSGIVSSSSGGPLRVVASISLMPGKYMQVVDMAGQLMVLGVSDHGVRLIQTVEDATVADRIRLWEENKPEPADNFLNGLQGLLKSTDFRLWKPRNEGRSNRTDFQAILKGRAPDDDVPIEDLEDLLKQQNRRLRAVSKPRPAEDSP